MSRTCKDCKYRQKEDINKGFICTNPDSDYLADWVEDNWWCGCWERGVKNNEDR